jgi:hypothetical protein
MVSAFRSVSFMAIPWIIVCLGACSKDDEPPKSTIEFDYQQHDGLGKLYANESNGGLSSFHPALQNGSVGVTYEIKILLDKPAAESTVVRFSTAGQATRGNLSAVCDFTLEPLDNLLTINKGEPSASLWLTVFEDYELEYFELNNIAYLVEGITITLDEVVSGTGILGKNKTFTVFILEDDPVVFLSWDPQDEPGADPGDVDMDLFLWFEDEVIASSTRTGIAFEGLSFSAGLANGQYGLSYTYYSGTSNDLEFYVRIVNANFDGFPGEKFFTATYTADNKNNYDESGISPFIAQTMNKSGLIFTQLTGITVNASGSRVREHERILAKETASQYPIQRLDVTKLMKCRTITRNLD